MKKAGFVLALICPVLSFGQIVINSDNIPQITGGYWYTNRVDNATVDLGSSGASQIWDFTTPALSTDSILTSIMDKNSTPYKDSCPQANLVFFDSSYMYFRLVTDSLKVVGASVNVPMAGIVMLKFNPAGNTPLPLQYNNQWVSNAGAIFTVGGYLSGQLTIRRHCNIDGYGTVKIPYGDFECLRILSYDTTHITIPGAGIDSTAAFVSYEFYTKNYGVVARVWDYGSNPNITTGVIERTTKFYPAVEEAKTVVKTTISHSPNPFYNNVTIKYSTTDLGKVNLKIYDLTGKVVRTLVNGEQSAGSHTTSWNGRDENGTKVPAGIYFYEFTTSTDKVTKKITLLR